MSLSKKVLPLLLLLFVISVTSISAADWPQDLGNAQRTGYGDEEPVTPWTYVWSFNGSDASGGTSTHLYDAPREARTVTGQGKVFVPAGVKGMYGLNLTNGNQDWNLAATSFLSTPAYDAATQSVFAGGADGKVYKITASTGTVTATFPTGSQIRKAPLLVGTFVYVVNDKGELYKINTTTMQSVWMYAAASEAATPPAYSISRDAVIFATNNLYVHAVTNTNGSLKWKVKPSPNNPSGTTQTTVSGSYIGNQFDRGWPVIAEKHGVVFVRMQLDHQAHFEGLNSGKFGTTNAENRAWLKANPQWRDLFALSLDDGSEPFIPATGYGSTEDFNGQTLGVMGAQPVVKVLPGGAEVVYMYFRNLQGSTTDFRWSGHLGEMVLDTTTVPGLVAGDFRFIKADGSSAHIIDEQGPLSMGGNVLFQNHWASANGQKITDRSASLGLTSTNPIVTTIVPPILRAMKACGTYSTTHYTTCSTIHYTSDGGSTLDGRTFTGPAFFGYWNVSDPPGWRMGSGNTAGTSYSSGFQPRYTYVANGYIVAEGNGGDIMVLKHSGTVTTPTTPPAPVPPTPTPAVPGDANGDTKVNGIDYIFWLNNYLLKTTKGASEGDFNGSGTVDGVDYIIWLNAYTI